MTFINNALTLIVICDGIRAQKSCENDTKADLKLPDNSFFFSGSYDRVKNNTFTSKKLSMAVNADRNGTREQRSLDPLKPLPFENLTRLFNSVSNNDGSSSLRQTVLSYFDKNKLRSTIRNFLSELLPKQSNYGEMRRKLSKVNLRRSFRALNKDSKLSRVKPFVKIIELRFKPDKPKNLDQSFRISNKGTKTNRIKPAKIIKLRLKTSEYKNERKRNLIKLLKREDMKNRLQKISPVARWRDLLRAVKNPKRKAEASKQALRFKIPKDDFDSSESDNDQCSDYFTSDSDVTGKRNCVKEAKDSNQAFSRFSQALYIGLHLAENLAMINKSDNGKAIRKKKKSSSDSDDKTVRKQKQAKKSSSDSDDDKTVRKNKESEKSKTNVTTTTDSEIDKSKIRTINRM